MNINIFLMGASLAYLILIAFLYFGKGKIDTFEIKLFKYILFVAIFGVVINLLGLGINLYTEGNSINNIVLSKLYYSYLLLMTYLLSSYIFIPSDSKLATKEKNKFKKFTFIYELAIMVNLILPTGNSNQIYAYGTDTNFSYFIIGITILSWILYFIKNLKKLKIKKYIAIITFIILVGPIIYMSNKYSEVFLISALISFIVVIMYHTIENPDVKMLNELKVVTEHAKKANRVKSEFLSNISHEIRTPLNAIVGFSEVIKAETDIIEARKDAEDIIKAAGNLLEIVNGILDISKIEANKIEIVNTDYKLLPILQNLEKLMITRIGKKPIKLVTNFSQDIPAVMNGDIAKIKLIITNLLTNAIKYTNQGEIYFNVNCINSNDFSSLAISVEDTGRGIKVENIEKLFTKFNRLEEDKNSTIEGTGLGLAITKSLVEMMSGEIVVQTKYEEGSKFTVYLNQKIIKLHGTNEPKKSIDEEKVDFAGTRILVVDDNKLNLKVTDKLLKKHNIETNLILSGKEAIELIEKEEKFDLILLDDMMPEMTGTETLGILRKMNVNIPIIVVTANALEGAKEKYLKKGFDGYISKPIAINELEINLKKVLMKKNKF